MGGIGCGESKGENDTPEISHSDIDASAVGPENAEDGVESWNDVEISEEILNGKEEEESKESVDDSARLYLKKVYKTLFDERGFEILLEASAQDNFESNLDLVDGAGENSYGETFRDIELLGLLEPNGDISPFADEMVDNWSPFIEAMGETERLEERDNGRNEERILELIHETSEVEVDLHTYLLKTGETHENWSETYERWELYHIMDKVQEIYDGVTDILDEKKHIPGDHISEFELMRLRSSVRNDYGSVHHHSAYENVDTGG